MHPTFTNRLFTTMQVLALAYMLGPSALAQDLPEHKDIVYGTVDGKELGLDIYLPSNVSSPPLVVWVHGGRWMNGSKERGVPMQFVDAGFAVAGLDFRQSTEARFPAMVHDIKGAVRFLRAHSDAYGYNSDRIAIAGSSSGAHLATLVGVTNDHSELEGTVGGNESTSSNVQAIISYYGASDLTTILEQSTPYGVGVREPALEVLLGAVPEAAPKLAELASPVTHVDRADPPLLLLHGDRDPQMPINQTHQLEGVYEELGLDVYFDVVHGSAHGGPGFYTPEHLDRAIAFLERTIGH
jgi:acetyl esterase/lipase